MNKLKISTPGRVCLFGEHQDYLQLPVVASAISLRISVEGKRRTDKKIVIQLPDLNKKESFSLAEAISYTEERDYFKSSVNILLRNSFTFSTGFDCVVKGKIPINAGTSSSSALIVTWINFLSRMSDQAVVLPPDQLARFAYEAEVLEFSEPGGMMDQYTTAYGGVVSIDFFPETIVNLLNPGLQTFVLGNSFEPKDTKFILARVKDQMLNVNKILKNSNPDFSLQTVFSDQLSDYRELLTDEQYKLFEGTIRNRDITREARAELNKQHPDHHEIGRLLNEHHTVLRDVQKISTDKINRMISAALDAGAYGAKINGSGGGGCMFAYAPDEPEKVKRAIEKIDAEAYVITSDFGSREENVEELVGG